MAKEKNTVEYFPFTVREGRTLYKLKKKYGLEGMGFFIQLFRFLAETPEHYYCIDDDYDRERLVEFIGVEEKKVLSMIETVVETGKIDKELYETYKIIASDDFFSSLEPVYAKRRTPLLTIEKLKTYVKDSGTFRSFPSRDTAESPASENKSSTSENKSSQTKLNYTKLDNIIFNDDCAEKSALTIIEPDEKEIEKAEKEKIEKELEKLTKEKLLNFFKRNSPDHFQDGNDYKRERKYIRDFYKRAVTISDNPEDRNKWIREILVAFSDICQGRAGPGHLKGRCIILPSKMMSTGIWPEVIEVVKENRKLKKRTEELEGEGGFDIGSIKIR